MKRKWICLGYPAPIHQENIILCALTDPHRLENRCLAVEAIKYIGAELARRVEEAALEKLAKEISCL